MLEIKSRHLTWGGPKSAKLSINWNIDNGIECDSVEFPMLLIGNRKLYAWQVISLKSWCCFAYFI